MTSRTLVKCDQKDCKRERDSSIHANTWFQLSYEKLHPYPQPSFKYVLDFCSLDCLSLYVQEMIIEPHTSNKHSRITTHNFYPKM